MYFISYLSILKTYLLLISKSVKMKISERKNPMKLEGSNKDYPDLSFTKTTNFTQKINKSLLKSRTTNGIS